MKKKVGQCRKHLRKNELLPRFIIFTCAILFAVFALAIYKFGWDWTGFNGGYSQITTTKISHGITTTTVRPAIKTLWDWLQLLIIPIVLAIGGFWLNQIQKKREGKTIERQAEIERKFAKKRDEVEREIGLDNQREAALQAYIDDISYLLLKEHLGDLKQEYNEVRKIARARTLSVLPRLDAKRKRRLIEFLYESGLISKNPQKVPFLSKSVNTNGVEVSTSENRTSGEGFIDLTGADLSNVDLSLLFLRKVCLSLTDLSGADLSWANLSEADLSGADLSGADLSQADLSKADLGVAFIPHPQDQEPGSMIRVHMHVTDLSNAKLELASLDETNLNRAILRGANLSKTQMRGTRLCHAELNASNLSEADLSGYTVPNMILNDDGSKSDFIVSPADLNEADLSEADLTNADLSGIDFSSTKVTKEQIEKAKSFKGVKMPAGEFGPDKNHKHTALHPLSTPLE